jgi:hypothetical protein
MNSKFYQRSGQRSIGCYVSKLGYQQVNAAVTNQSESRPATTLPFILSGGLQHTVEQYI